MLAALLLAFLPAFPSLEEGVKALGERRYEAALERLAAASKEAPADPRPPFFRGATLNRLARFEEALGALDEAARKGSMHPDLPFERGWALLGLGRHGEAIPLLEGYAATHPDHGQSSEFLGRALLGDGQTDRGEAALKEALRRDPSLAATVRVYLARVEESRESRLEAHRQISALLREAPDSPTGRILQDQVTRLTTAPSARPWQFRLSSAVGYNSNVVALGQGSTLSSDVSSAGTQFLDLALDARRDWRPGDALISAGYSYLDRVYDGLGDYNLQDHYGFLSVARAKGAFRPALRAAHEATLLGGERYRDLSTLRPSLAWRHAGWGTLEGAATLGEQDYDRPGIAVQDRDGSTRDFRLTEFLTPFLKGVLLRAGVFRQEQDTRGNDFDVVSRGWQAGARAPLLFGVVLDAAFTRSRDRYEHLNSLAGTGGFAFSRKDTVETWKVQAVRPLGERFEVFLEYQFMDQDSNVSAYRYHQHVVSGGMSLKF